jgi:hypothetical protein
VAKTRLWWVILPYMAIFLGMMILRSAWGALIGFHLTLLPLLATRRQTISPRFLAPVSKRILLPVAAAGLSAGLGLWLLWPYVGLPTDFPARVSALGLAGLTWPFFIAYFTLVNPWLEEAYWRDILTSSSPYPALVDFLFAGFHLIILCLFVGPPWMFFAFTILTLGSWFWRQVSRYTGSLLPAVLSHLLADLSILVVLLIKAMS